MSDGIMDEPPSMSAEHATFDEGAVRDVDGSAFLALQASMSVLLGMVVTVIWAVTGMGHFWPAWVWFGLAIPLGVHLALRQARRSPPGRLRGLAVHGALSGLIAAILLTIWALAGGGAFWPLIPVLVLGSLVALHAVLSAAVHRLTASRRERQLAERVDVLTRTRRGALDVQAAELRRIERDLHDGAQARLVALSMQLGRAEERLEDKPEIADLVRQARGEASAAIAELRDLARGIAPPVLADRGLEAAVEALGRRSAIPVTVDAHLERRPVPVVETGAYFVVAEALTNAAKHAAGAAAHVLIRSDATRLIVEVADDGPGGADPDGGGLTGMRHRVEALDGILLVISPPGAGTTIHAELPCG
jgi:signal transduction histidine kinase